MSKRELETTEIPPQKKQKIESKIEKNDTGNNYSDTITKYDFKKFSKPLTIIVNDGNELIANIREIKKENSIGWHGNKNIEYKMDNKSYIIQYNINITVKKSKFYKLGNIIDEKNKKNDKSKKNKTNVVENKIKLNNNIMDKKDFLTKAKSFELKIKEINCVINMKPKINKQKSCGWFGSKPKIIIDVNDYKLDCNAQVNAWIKDSKNWKDSRIKNIDNNNDEDNDLKK